MRSWMIGFVTGAIVASGLPLAILITLFVVVFCLFFVTLFCCRKWLTLLVCGALVGMGLASVYATGLLADRLPEHCVGQGLSVSGVVTSIAAVTEVRKTTRRQRFEFSVEHLRATECVGPRRIQLAYYGDQEIEPGQRWLFHVKLKRPWGTANPGSSNWQAWYAGQGIDAVGHVLNPKRAELLQRDASARVAHHSVRLAISRQIALLPLPPDSIAVLQAVTVADKNQVDPRLWRLFRDLGISHLLVISGLHVGLVAGVGFAAGAVLRRALVGSVPISLVQTCLAFFPAAFYAALAGFSLPTQRALAMLAVFLLGTHLGRAGGGFQRLLTAAVLILAINPLAPVGAGFWLSFGAVAALLWFSACRVGSAGAAHRWRSLVGVHAYMGLVMLPMGALFFGGASLLGMVANMLMIPLIGFVVVPLALLGVFCHLLDWPAADLFWQMAAWPLNWLLPHLQALFGHESAVSFVPIYGSVVAAALALLGVALLSIARGPVRAVVGVLILPLILPSASAALPGSQDNTILALLDVGQGTASVISNGQRAFLYDTGGGDPAGANAAVSVVLPYLRSRGIQQLDTFVVSHGDNDHSAGATSVLSALNVQRLRYGGGWHTTSEGLPCRAGQAWQWPAGIRFQVLSPGDATGLSSNDASCVVLVDIDGFRVLLAGDVEQAQEREMVAYWRDKLRADIVLVPHHGSGTSSSHVLLKTVSAQLGLISAGYANGFGHPKGTIVARLAQYGVRTLNTAQEGAVEIELAGGKVVDIRRYRRGWRPYWW